MGSTSNPSFQFRPAVSPRYIQPLLVELRAGRTYEMEEMRDLLRSSGFDVEGSGIVRDNISAWSQAGLGRTGLMRSGKCKTKTFQLTTLGQQITATYSTNRELFYDLMHFIFYSTWLRSRSGRHLAFWLYMQICSALWSEAPRRMDSRTLTNRLQLEAQQMFTDYSPSIPQQSIQVVSSWLSALTPPFLVKQSNKSQLNSCRRSFCTPQLFHLAVDLAYQSSELAYGTSMSVDDQRLEAICEVCLLDTESFWEMAALAKMTVRGFDIRKGQWGTSIALEGPPNWIDLPDLSSTQGDEPTEEDGGDE